MAGAPLATPPDAAVPIAWAAIETLLAFAAYRLLRNPGSSARNRALGWLGANVAAIGGWSRLFFGQRNLPASTLAAASMIGTGAAYIMSRARSTARLRRPAFRSSPGSPSRPS